MIDNIQISLTIQAAQAGGLAVFEYSNDTPSVLVFSGNLNETTEYLNGRMACIIQPVEAVPTTVSRPADVYSSSARAATLLRKAPLMRPVDMGMEADHA